MEMRAWCQQAMAREGPQSSRVRLRNLRSLPCPGLERTLASCLQPSFTLAAWGRRAGRQASQVFSRGAEAPALEPALLTVLASAEEKVPHTGLGPPGSLRQQPWQAPYHLQGLSFPSNDGAEVSRETGHVNILRQGAAVIVGDMRLRHLCVCQQQGSGGGQRYGL